MLSGDVVVLEHDIGLLAITKCLHIFPGYLHELLIGDFIVRMRIERTVEHRFLGTTVLRYQCLYVGNHVFHRITSLSVLIQLSGKENTCFPFLHLFEVVADSPSKVFRCRNLRYHFCGNLW